MSTKTKHTITITFETDETVNPHSDVFKEVSLDAFAQLETLFDDHRIEFINDEWNHSIESIDTPTVKWKG